MDAFVRILYRIDLFAIKNYDLGISRRCTVKINVIVIVFYTESAQKK